MSLTIYETTQKTIVSKDTTKANEVSHSYLVITDTQTFCAINVEERNQDYLVTVSNSLCYVLSADAEVKATGIACNKDAILLNDGWHFFRKNNSIETLAYDEFERLEVEGAFVFLVRKGDAWAIRKTENEFLCDFILTNQKLSKLYPSIPPFHFPIRKIYDHLPQYCCYVLESGDKLALLYLDNNQKTFFTPNLLHMEELNLNDVENNHSILHFITSDAHVLINYPFLQIFSNCVKIETGHLLDKYHNKTFVYLIHYLDGHKKLLHENFSDYLNFSISEKVKKVSIIYSKLHQTFAILQYEDSICLCDIDGKVLLSKCTSIQPIHFQPQYQELTEFETLPTYSITKDFPITFAKLSQNDLIVAQDKYGIESFYSMSDLYHIINTTKENIDSCAFLTDFIEENRYLIQYSRKWNPEKQRYFFGIAGLLPCIYTNIEIVYSSLFMDKVLLATDELDQQALFKKDGTLIGSPFIFNYLEELMAITIDNTIIYIVKKNHCVTFYNVDFKLFFEGTNYPTRFPCNTLQFIFSQGTKKRNLEPMPSFNLFPVYNFDSITDDLYVEITYQNETTALSKSNFSKILLEKGWYQFS